MARFLPFDPSHDQIYEEYQVASDSLNLDTVAFDYVLAAARSGARMIVLTGDAGHGKTHLCRRVIESYLGYDEEQARRLINEACDGRQVIRAAQDAATTGALRIFKDFSEFSPEIAAELVESSNDGEAVTIICANEGRLRAVLASDAAGSYCRELLKSFETSFDDGKASRDGSTHIVNLNHQSTAAGEDGQSLGDRAIRDWTSGTRWRACADCDARDACPINRNREMLSERVDSEVAGTRKQKLRLLFATLERIGYVITIRDMLMAFAYLLTGGLKCEDVHRMRKRRKRGWQQSYAFYNLAFEAPDTLSKEQLNRLPLMQQLPKLDPGRRAIREIDERIVNQQEIFGHGQLDLLFPAPSESEEDVIDAADGIDEIIGDPRNRKQRASEAENVTRVVRALRRRAYVDGVANNNLDMAHLGFPYGADFLGIVHDNLDAPARTLLKKRVIAGLHHIQGLQFADQTPTLHLVDPAFGRSMSGTAILAARIKPADVDLIRLSEKWGRSDEVPHHVKTSVDWIDRHVVLRIVDQKDAPHDLLLDLMTFDCILRAAAGHVPTKFYEHDIRRVASFLGRIAQSAHANSDQINLIRDGRSQTISIDGSTIQVGAGA
ncbi:hypothetical protein SAMN05443432_102301 [Roseovarius litoreus]|uniref:Uncharacterized protein n=1 Tax=Roseovarius litoreus TaxID=1155722 RepID=A0A1M7CU84_9RHOB|nr:ATP-binding protein [Roseovarius litoreus]SHL70730.1 hypothetical protein SAMN05443432_102301 [Roseovarius litoreus]